MPIFQIWTVVERIRTLEKRSLIFNYWTKWLKFGFGRVNIASVVFLCNCSSFSLQLTIVFGYTWNAGLNHNEETSHLRVIPLEGIHPNPVKMIHAKKQISPDTLALGKKKIQQQASPHNQGRGMKGKIWQTPYHINDEWYIPFIQASLLTYPQFKDLWQHGMGGSLPQILGSGCWLDSTVWVTPTNSLSCKKGTSYLHLQWFLSEAIGHSAE